MQTSIVAEMILTAVPAWEESRGRHRRLDFPDADDGQWGCHVAFRRGADGRMTVFNRPVD
jgi:succinate dehydrogenase/fumarate reductase flavoprotein subunit